MQECVGSWETACVEYSSGLVCFALAGAYFSLSLSLVCIFQMSLACGFLLVHFVVMVWRQDIAVLVTETRWSILLIQIVHDYAYLFERLANDCTQRTINRVLR